MKLNPYIKPKRNQTPLVMLDVIIALLPIVVIAVMAFGQRALVLMSVSVATAVLTDFLFSALLLKKYKTVLDGSAVVTGLLLALIISPLTPWYVMAFGAFSAIVFGKIVWGGLGKNRFNPALVGREFMSVFFASVMTSSGIWTTKGLVNVPATQYFPGLNPTLDTYLSGMVYKTSGALGEYSVLCIALGGLYLLLRKRISWQIPFALLAVFSLMFWMVDDYINLKFSLAGVLFGTIFMATDMPSSPTTAYGKFYYGAMIGLVAFILIAAGVRFEYMSYSILILNGFSFFISDVFRPRIWGQALDKKKRTEQIFLLTLAIIGVSLSIVSLYYYDLIPYLVYVFIVYVIFKFNFSIYKSVNNPI